MEDIELELERYFCAEEATNRIGFAVELIRLINQYSQENKSNTPDYLLAQYMIGCLGVFEHIVKQRDEARAGENDNESLLGDR